MPICNDARSPLGRDERADLLIMSDFLRTRGAQQPGSPDGPVDASRDDPAHEELHSVEVATRTYPTIPVATWWDLRRRFQRAIPDAVDIEFLQTVLGVRKALAKNLRRQLIALGLVDEASRPTELAARWRIDADYPVACQDIVTHSYPRELREFCAPPAPERARVEGWFERNANVGKAAAARMATFYLLVAAADPKGHGGGREPAGRAEEREDPNPAAPRPASIPDPEAEVRPDRSLPPARRNSGYARERNRYLVRHWVLIVIGMLIGGLAGFGAASMRPDRYVAQTTVVATKSHVPDAEFGPVAKIVFSSAPVLQPIIDQLGLSDTPASLVASGSLGAQSESTRPVLSISARSADPQRAEALAAAATNSFVAVAEEKGLGTFAAFESGPATLESHRTGQLVLLGFIGGAVIAILLLVTTFFLRDPVVSEEDARREFSPDVAFRVAVSSRRTPTDDEGRDRQEATAFDVWPSRVVSSLVETIQGRGDGRDPCAVITTGGGSAWAGEAVARTLEARASGHDGGRRSSHGFTIASSDEPGLSETLAVCDPVVTIVPIGTPGRSVRRVDEEIRALGTRFQVLVLVDPRR